MLPFLLVFCSSVNCVPQFIDFDSSISNCVHYFVKASSVNIRSGPTKNSLLIRVAKKNEVLCVESITGEWAKLSDGKYCMVNFLARSSPSPSPTPPPSPIPIPTTCTTYYVNASSVNIRSGPGTDFPKVRQESRNAQLCVVSINGNWAKLIDGRYVCTDYISRASGPIPGPSPPPTPSPSKGDFRQCPDFWNQYAKGRYPTREEFGVAVKGLTGKFINYTQNAPNRWSGINKHVCPPTVPPFADCSSFSTWIYWTLMGKGPDIINKNTWAYGAGSSMRAGGTSISINNREAGDLQSHDGHVTVLVSKDETISYGQDGPANIRKWNYRSVLNVTRYNIPWGQTF